MPGFKSFKTIKKEIEHTSMSRERFIDFIKVVGLLMVIFNTSYLIRFNDSFGEYQIYNLSFDIVERIFYRKFFSFFNFFDGHQIPHSVTELNIGIIFIGVS